MNLLRIANFKHGLEDIGTTWKTLILDFLCFIEKFLLILIEFSVFRVGRIA